MSPSTPIERGTQMLPPEGSGDPLGDAGLAIARGPEEEHAPPGGDRRAEPVDDARVEQEPLEGVHEVSGAGCAVGDPLGDDGVDIVLQRDRGSAEVRAPVREPTRGVPSVVGDLVEEVVDPRRAAVGEEPRVLELVQAADDKAVGEADLVGDRPATGIPARGQELQDQPLDLAVGEPRLGQRGRLHRRERAQLHRFSDHVQSLRSGSLILKAPRPRPGVPGAMG